MADEEKRAFDIPWATLLPLIAALAGVIAQLRPLVSSRPAAPGEKAIEVMAQQDVDARLWQDPLLVAQKAKAQLDAELLVRPVPAERLARHQLERLVERVRSLARGSKVLLLAVMLDSGPYPEQGESRLRARQAILAGMNESGWVPVDSEHIGYVAVPTPTAFEMWWGKNAEETAVLIPWEECKVDKTPAVFPPDTQRVYVLWLPSGNFNPRPLDAFARLIAPFLDFAGNVQVRLIGPANSTGLQCMLDEKKSWEDWPQSPPGPVTLPTREDVLNRISVISPRATASDKALLGGTAEKGAVEEAIENSVNPRTGFRFLRTITTDDLVLRALIGELALRDVHVSPVPEPMSLLQKVGALFQKSNAAREKWVDGDRIVILSEWDSAYGRSLATTFEDEAAPQEKHFDKKGNEVKTRITSYRYMHGIDGRLPGDPAEAKTKEESQNSAAPGSNASEATEGVDQSDFLRRLARQLKAEDLLGKRAGERGVRAVGLLGSDIYDKLMILRALRPELPDALFFTNNYDAHFERKEDWADVRNLIVASPFGSTLGGPTGFKQKVAPFRDNNQTSMFISALVATGRLDDAAIHHELARQPRVYEIGRRGAEELGREAGLERDAPQAHSPSWLRDWVLSGGRIWLLAGAGLALVTVLLWLKFGMVNRKREDESDLAARVKNALSSTKFWLSCTVPAVVVAVAWHAQTHPADQEPLAFLSGISIWPSEMLRLIAFLLAIHFLIKAHLDLRSNEVEVNECFHLESPLRRTWPVWRDLRLGLRRWTQHSDWMQSDTSFPAEKAWLTYLVRNQFWPRFVRVAVFFCLYFIFSLCAFALFPTPVVPARGASAFTFDLKVLILAVIALMILTFYVVDALRLNTNFIRIFASGLTQWKPNIPPGNRRVPPLSEEEISRYHDIIFVAQRTEVVARLIWYPLIVLTLMVLARSSLFDNWTWPPMLLVIFALNVIWAIGSAIVLRRAAEQLRETAVDNLERLRLANYKDRYKRKMFNEIIAEIRSLKKGAFAPLSEQPFIRAIIVPSGGLGLLAVGQRLLDIF